MTQEATPVGGSDDTIIAAEPTIEDRFAALPEVDEEEPEAPAAEGEPELTAEDLTDEDEADAPPIAPPVSWTGENKEKFLALPRDVQEYVAQRETERERFVQTKAQEVKQAETRAQAQATEAFQTVAQTFAQQISALRVQIPERPSHQLQAEDPYTYAEQMDAFERAAGHNQWIDQQLGQVSHQLRQAQAVEHQREQMETLAALQSNYPEYLDETKGPELRQRLGSTAAELGYSAEQIATADFNDILAMQRATDWREKAAKYDRLMAGKMEKVREAKGLPKVSRPGAAQAPGAVANHRYTADRNAMRQGDRDAAARVFSKFL